MRHNTPAVAQDGSPRRRIDILTPTYNEEASLPLYERALQQFMAANTECDFRVLFIDDGSLDGSWRIIRDICNRDPRFHGIRLSRNYGSHTALTAGFHHATGDAVATLACDLQDPPEVLLAFLDKWRAGAQIVWGHRKSREDGYWRPLASRIFEALLRTFAMPAGSRFTTGSFFLVDKKVAASFRCFREHNRTTFALVAWTGFEQQVVEYDRRPRAAGRSGWSFGKMVKTMYDTFLGFSFMPIRLMTLIGAAVFLFSLFLAGYVAWNWLIGHPQLGWSSLVLLLSFFFGIQFLLMGFMGEYLYRIYAEVLARPLYFISDTTGADAESGE